MGQYKGCRQCYCPQQSLVSSKYDATVEYAGMITSENVLVLYIAKITRIRVTAKSCDQDQGNFDCKMIVKFDIKIYSLEKISFMCFQSHHLAVNSYYICWFRYAQ